MAPASLRESFHLAFPGGYLIHIMRVVKASFGAKKLYAMMGGSIDFTDEEMIFAALHHDLGKLGDKEMGSYYLPEDNDWKLRQGVLYKLNPHQQYMEVSDRAVFLLQHYGVKHTWKEYLGIKLADGMYKEAAKTYLAGFNDDARAFPSIPARHDLWRRESANWLAGLVVKHIIDKEDAFIMAHDLAYHLAKNVYHL